MDDAERLADYQMQLGALLEARPEVRFAYLHGSAAEDRPFHDLDVALYLEPDHPAAHDPFDYEMERSIEMTLTLRKEVDVHVLNGAPLGFQHRAVQGKLLFARDSIELADYLERLALRYIDFAHLGHAYLLEVLQG